MYIQLTACLTGKQKQRITLVHSTFNINSTSAFQAIDTYMIGGSVTIGFVSQLCRAVNPTPTVAIGYFKINIHTAMTSFVFFACACTAPLITETPSE